MAAHEWIATNVKKRFIKNKPSSFGKAVISGVASCEIQSSMLEHHYFCKVVFRINANALLQISFNVDHHLWPDQVEVHSRAEGIAKAHIKAVY